LAISSTHKAQLDDRRVGVNGREIDVVRSHIPVRIFRYQSSRKVGWAKAFNYKPAMTANMRAPNMLT
jgi:hypothetical protein